MVGIHSLQEFNTAFELRAARKMISTEEPGSEAALQQRMVRADLLCSGLGRGVPEKGVEERVWGLLLMRSEAHKARLGFPPK